MQLQKRGVCGAPAALAIAMQTRQCQTMSEVTVQHALAEWRDRTQVGTDRREGSMVVHHRRARADKTL